MLSFQKVKQHYITARNVMQQGYDHISDKCIIATLWTLQPSRQRLLAVRLFTQLNAILYLSLLTYALMHPGYWNGLYWVKGIINVSCKTLKIQSKQFTVSDFENLGTGSTQPDICYFILLGIIY